MIIIVINLIWFISSHIILYTNKKYQVMTDIMKSVTTTYMKKVICKWKGRRTSGLINVTVGVAIISDSHLFYHLQITVNATV